MHRTASTIRTAHRADSRRFANGKLWTAPSSHRAVTFQELTKLHRKQLRALKLRSKEG